MKFIWVLVFGAFTYLGACSDTNFSGTPDNIQQPDIDKASSKDLNNSVPDRDIGSENAGVLSEGGLLSSGCRYMDVTNAGKPIVMFKLPMPLISDPRLGPNPVPATSVPHAAAALFLSGGPDLDITAFTSAKKGVMNGKDYIFNLTAYKDITSAASILLGGAAWKLADIIGPRLVEAEYKVTILDAFSQACIIKAESIPVTRGDIVGNPSGCFDKDTKITMFDGSRLPVSALKVGDSVLNPITMKPAAIDRIIFGPETKEGMIEVGTTLGKVVVTSKHPFATKSGYKQARHLKKGELILVKNNLYSKINHIYMRKPNPEQRVYNFVVAADSKVSLDHMVEADGVATGDLFLQEQLERATVGEGTVLSKGVSFESTRAH